MTYQVFYDVVSAENPFAPGIGIGVVLMLVSGILGFVPLLIQRARPDRDEGFTPIRLVQGLFLLSLIWTVAMMWLSSTRNSELQAVSSSNACSIVSGNVTDFVPAPEGGHANESFRVTGIPFEFSDYVVTGGFNQSASHGGPLRQGLPVRICYVGDGIRGGNVIVRLEIGS